MIDPASCRRLWASVLVQCLRDAIDPQCRDGKGMGSPMDTYRAKAWIGTRDFREVCELAGVHPGSVETFANYAMAVGESKALRPHGRDKGEIRA